MYTRGVVKNQTPPRMRLRPLLAMAVVAAGLAAGCGANRRLAALRLDARRESLAALGRAVEQSEAQRPAGIRRTVRRVQRTVRTDTERTAHRNPSVVREYVQRDVIRFRDNQPVYGRTIGRILAGRPERIGPNGIMLFY